MKATGKINGRLIVVLALALLASPAPAIEGLKLQIHCPDVVLSWPSVEGEYYIVQWRDDLSTNSSWVTLTNLLPAEIGTNITTFVHSNRVDCPTGQIFGMMFSGGGSSESQTDNEKEDSPPPYPTVVPKDGSKMPLPLAIYPPGIDLTGYIIVWPDGSADEWSEDLVAKWRAIQQEEGGGPQTEDAGGGAEPGTGFYQVVRDGVYICGLTNLTNGVLSGTVPVLLEAGNADPASNGVGGILECATLLVDGVQFAGDGVLGAPPAYPWRFEMDTGFLENGEHWIQVEVTWFDPEAQNENTIYFTRQSPPVFISVSNQIYYPQWEPLVGEAGIAAFYLKTVDPDAAYQIEISDVNSNYVQTLTGYATNGVIEAYWNLVDTNGVARTNAEVDYEFSAVAHATGASGSASKKTPPKKQPRSDWPEHGKWTIAFQDFFKYHYSQNGYMQGSINGFANTSAKYGGYLLYYPQPGQTNDVGQTYPIRYDNPKHPDTNVTAQAIAKDHALLLFYLTNSASRNFYYNGHGSPTTIAGGFPAAKVKNALKHRYRFVFMDGCETSGGEWDKAFKINGPGRFALIYYQLNGMRPAAFCGFTTDTYFSDGQPLNVGGVDYDGTIPWQVPYFIFNFLFYWDTDLMGWRLNQALRQAADDLPTIPGWPVQPGRNLEIYGYDDLRIDEFNHKSQWP